LSIPVNRQSDKQTDTGEHITSLADVKNGLTFPFPATVNMNRTSQFKFMEMRLSFRVIFAVCKMKNSLS